MGLLGQHTWKYPVPQASGQHSQCGGVGSICLARVAVGGFCLHWWHRASRLRALVSPHLWISEPC